MRDKQCRMCSYCRAVKKKDELFRIVLIKGSSPQLDISQKAQGRGAYLCKNENCIRNGQKKRALERSLSCKVAPEVYNEMSDILGK